MDKGDPFQQQMFNKNKPPQSKKSAKKEARLSFIYVFFYTLLIFITIPFNQVLQAHVTVILGKSVFGFFVLTVIASATVGGIVYLRKFTEKKVPKGNYLWLLSISILFVFFTIRAWKIPIEAVHFVEYGILSLLLFRALQYHIKDVTIYFTSTLIILYIGTFDEIIQWVVPNRYWEFHDVGYNILAGGLIQLGIWKGIKPKAICEPVRSSSIKILSIVTVACTILLGFCLSNTPSLMQYYTQRLPFLSFLNKNHDMMSEYGYKHKDPQIGTFYSRLKKDELKKSDYKMSETYAAIIKKNIGMRYMVFLQTYNSIDFPFLYEFRIHFFRRNRYLELSKMAKNSADRQKALFIAFKENLILEAYFLQTLKKSGFRWDDELRKKIKKLIDFGKPYKSPVSSQLFTTFTVKTLWIFIGSMVFGLAIINLFFRKYHRFGNFGK